MFNLTENLNFLLESVLCVFIDQMLLVVGLQGQSVLAFLVDSALDKGESATADLDAKGEIPQS